MQWIAKEVEDLKTVGRTKPLVASCTLATASLADVGTAPQPNSISFVLKYPGSPEFRPSMLYSEMLTSLIARHVGISTPTPAVVEITAQFAAAANNVLPSYGCHHSIVPGLAYGSEYIRTGLRPIIAGMSMTSTQLAQAALIYAFDLLIQNSDRKVDNPNCQQYRDGYIIYDHELAFSFVYILGEGAKPWQLPDNSHRNHLFYRDLRGRDIDWMQVLAPFRTLTDELLNEFHSKIPFQWDAYSGKIRKHLSEVIINIEDFGKELHASL